MEFRGGRFGDGKLGGIWRGRRLAERRSRRVVLGLGLERLEGRVVLSTSTWTGHDALNGGGNNWSDAGNWDVAPTSGTNTDLVFPTGLTGAALTSNDDIQNGSFGALTIADSGYTIVSSQGFGVGLSGTIDSSAASGTSTLNLPVDFGTTAATVTVDQTSAALAMGGAITGSGGLTKAGSGVLDLKGTSTYTGGTTVSGGALLVDGSIGGAVAVDSGATLGGAGTVGSIAATAATVSPGDSSTVTGILTATGSLTMDGSSNFNVSINGTSPGTGYDQLVAGGTGGTVNLGGATLNIATNSFNPTPDTAFTILHNTSGSAIVGKFDSGGQPLNEGDTITANGHQFKITYAGGTTGQDVMLTVQTPPTVTWSGTDALGDATKDNWTDTANWVGGKAPVAGDAIIFPNGPTGNAQKSNNDIANTTFFSITVQAGGYTIGGDGVTLAGSVDSSQSTGSSTISLPITFNPGSGTVTVDNAGGTLLLSGTVSSTIGLIKQGQGTLNLVGSDGSLAAAINAGTLLVDGTAGDISVNTGATLGGSGSVDGVSTVSGTVNPGDSPTVTGILTDTGNLVLDSHSSFAATLNGTTPGLDTTTTPNTGYDQLVAGGTGGTVNLANATLNISIGASFPSGGGNTFTILKNTSGSAIVGTFSGLAEGATVTFSGQSFSISYKGGSDGQDVVLTSLISTTTSVSPVTTTPVSGQSVTLTATVTPGSGSGTPTGTVTFFTGTGTSAVNLGTGTLSSGTATVTTSKLTAGTDSITATYSGDTTFATSTASPVAVTVGQASTTTVIRSSPNPSVTAQSVTLTATVTAVSPGSGTPTGSVKFFSGTTLLGTASLAVGVATFTTKTLPAGTSSIDAVYSGDSNFTASTSPTTNQVVALGTTTISISASNTNPFALQPITLSAVVSTATGLATPTGSVTFQDSNGTKLGTATLSSGIATLTAATLPVGAQSITAVYSGDSNFTTMSSAPLRVVIGGQTDLFVNQVYEDVLAIPANISATYWTALINGGYPPKVVATDILQSKAARIAAVNQVYVSLLHRHATTKELKQALASGSTSTTPLDIQVFGSKEYYLVRGHGTTDGFLTALAQDWFGAPFPAFVQARLARQLSRGVSRTKVAREVITSPSGVNAQVDSIFQVVLERPATAKEERQFAPLVRQGNVVELYATLFASREFKEKFVLLA